MEDNNEAANNKPSHSIAEVLGIAPATNTPLTIEHDPGETDYEFAQKQIKAALAIGEAAMDEMYQIAVSSQHARAFEVFGQLMEKQIAGARQLIETKARNASIDTGEKETKSKTINNNLFVGSTSELQKWLKERKE